MSGTAAGPSAIHQGSPSRASGSGRGGDRLMVPEAEFSSYYGRPVVKPAPWKYDIATYLFSGGVAAGSSMLAAGADLTGRPALRRTARLTSLAALGFSVAALVHDLGRPSRFLNMLRVAKLTSPMSVGHLDPQPARPVRRGRDRSRGRRDAAGELAARTGGAGAQARPAGRRDRRASPRPRWRPTPPCCSPTPRPRRGTAPTEELPFVFCASAAAASGGMGMIGSPVAQAGPGAAPSRSAGRWSELAAEQRMERSMGLAAEPLHQDKAGRLMRASKALTVAGAVGAVLGRRSRALSALSGAALMAGSLCTRLGVFEAGMQSARDPKYTVVPQRERVERGEPVRYGG